MTRVEKFLKLQEERLPLEALKPADAWQFSARKWKLEAIDKEQTKLARKMSPEERFQAGLERPEKSEGQLTRHTPGDKAKDAAMALGIVMGMAGAATGINHALGDRPEPVDNGPIASRINAKHPESLRPFVERLAAEEMREREL